MQPEEAKEIIEKVKTTINESWAVLKDLVREASTARLLAENEPLGELVTYTLLDDAMPESKLWVHFARLAKWLKATEERYAKQFPEDWPRIEGRYDVSSKPDGFRTRFEIFKEEVEAADWDPLCDTRLVLHDPVMVTKTFRNQRPRRGKPS
jgi:hypothetical protein